MKTLLLLFFCFGPAQLSVIRNYTWYNVWPLTWSNVQKTCRYSKADLMTARTSVDLRLSINSFLAWIGLHRTSSSQDWQWVDGNNKETLPQFSAEPHESHRCAAVRYNGDKAYSYACQYWLFFFCEDSQGKITFINKTATWEKAREHCRVLNMDLAIFNPSSSDAPSKVTRSFLVWTGLHTNADNGSWSWSNGLHSDYRNWTKGSGPDSSPASGSCVAVSSLSKSMSVQNCSEVIPFMCQKHIVDLVLEHLSWEEALERCWNHSVRPFSLLSVDEEDLEFAVLQANGADTSKVWVGLRFLEGVWFWTDGAPVALTSLPSLCPEFYCGALDLSSRSIQPTDCNEKLNLLCYQAA